MNREIFNTYVNRVLRAMSIDKEVLFSRSKKREATESRQILVWLCEQRPIKRVFIKNYMEENGYNISYNDISYCVKSIDNKIANDADYSIILNKII